MPTGIDFMQSLKWILLYLKPLSTIGIQITSFEPSVNTHQLCTICLSRFRSFLQVFPEERPKRVIQEEIPLSCPQNLSLLASTVFLWKNKNVAPKNLWMFLKGTEFDTIKSLRLVYLYNREPIWRDSVGYNGWENPIAEMRLDVLAFIFSLSGISANASPNLSLF